MADENTNELTPDQVAANLAGRQADVSEADKRAAMAAAAAKQAAANKADENNADQKQIDAENAAKEALAKKAADEAAAKEAADKNDDGTWKEKFIDSGSEAGNAAIKIMESAGIAPVEANSIFEKAIASGKLEDIKWDVLKSRLSPEQYTLAEIGIRTHYAEHTVKQNETRDYGFTAVGGEDNWNKVKDWAQDLEKKDKAFAADLDGIRKAITNGGYGARLAINDLKAKYEADPKNGSLTAAKMERGQSLPGTKDAVGDPLSRADFFKERRKLGDKATPAQVQALLARRQAGEAKGL